MQIVETNTVVVGASAAGLATAASLKRAGVPFELLEQSDRVGSAWHGHYERLHLHTSRGFSGLPYRPMPSSYPRYPSRAQVIEYLERYAAELELVPRFGEHVETLRRVDGFWTASSKQREYRSRNVVVATGYTRKPKIPSFLDQERFTGEIFHSSRYVNGARFRDRSVLVVGFGNSGGEIAIDLCEHGSRPTLAIRGAVNVIPRDLFGVPVLAVGIALSALPPGAADFLSRPLLAVTVGDITKLGLRRLPYGPNRQIVEHARIPVLDVGTLDLIRGGRIAVAPGIRRFTARGVVFDDDRELEFDAVVLATGYEPALRELLPETSALDERGVPLTSGRELEPGLYFCGFYVAPTGMLREIGLEARRIAARIRKSAYGTS